MYKRMKWTQDKEDKLQKLWLKGIKTARIAKIFGVSRDAISKKARRLELPRRKTVIHNSVKTTKVVSNNNYKTLHNIKSNECHYPVDEFIGEDMLFCSERVERGYSYCSYHCSICYRNKKKN